MTDTLAAPKAPPAWMKRDPLSRDTVANALERMASERRNIAASCGDKDVRAGLEDSARAMAAAANTLRTGQPMPSGTLGQLEGMGEARLACARTTTEPTNRATYMDGAHIFREAVRHLKGGR